MKKNIYLILDNLRSAHNVGAIFRTADATRVKKIFLCGITPTPSEEKQGNRRVKKASVGADKFVKWSYVKNIKAKIEKLKKQGVSIVALEQTPESINYCQAKYNFPLALVIGNEIEGVGESVLKLADQKIEIPMYGKKNSLNVATATGIALYKILEFTNPSV